MKKLFLTLIALAATMSIDAQIVKITNGDQLLAKYLVPNGGKVVFEKAPPITGSVYAKTIPEAGQDIYEMYDEITKYNALNIYTTYQNTWGKHEFKAMAGFNQESSWYKYFYGSILGQTVPSVPSFGGGTGTKNLNEDYVEYAIRGGFARLNYAYDNRYLIELDARYDGSSKFPKNSRFGFFPSVSVGWRIGQEHWMEGAKSWLDELKIRASYGSIGNQKIDPYQFTSTMSIGQSTAWLDGGDKVTTISVPALVSSTFTWEKVTTLDIGLDFNAFQNRLQATFDYYNRKTTGMLAPGIEIPSVVGRALLRITSRSFLA